MRRPFTFLLLVAAIGAFALPACSSANTQQPASPVVTTDTVNLGAGITGEHYQCSTSLKAITLAPGESVQDRGTQLTLTKKIVGLNETATLTVNNRREPLVVIQHYSGFDTLRTDYDLRVRNVGITWSLGPNGSNTNWIDVRTMTRRHITGVTICVSL